MARETNAKCRKCRRAQEKLLLKGDRCATPKCAMIKRAYAPGQHGKRISRGGSEYGAQLAVKQKIRRTYGILEKQFRKHFDEVKGKKGITGNLLLVRLETRLDNIVFRIGIASSRSLARQLVTHGFISVNGKKASTPSANVKVGDIVAIRENKSQKTYIQNIKPILKNKQDTASWISFDPGKMEAKIMRLPEPDEIGINADAQVVVEYYSR